MVHDTDCERCVANDSRRTSAETIANLAPKLSRHLQRIERCCNSPEQERVTPDFWICDLRGRFGHLGQRTAQLRHFRPRLARIFWADGSRYSTLA